MKLNPLQHDIDPFNLEGYSMLIAEDDLFSYEIMEYMLSETRAILFHADTGPIAIEMIQTYPIDFVFLDLQLPELNGFEVVKQIRQYNKDIPVIAQTAFVLQRDKPEIINAGFNDLLIKPFSKVDIFNMVNKYLKRMLQECEICDIGK